LAALGAKSVIGIDFSAANLAGAQENCADVANIQFQQGTAVATGLPAHSADFVLERAIIHHLDDLATNFREVQRILRPDGLLLIQDRTMADVLQPPSPNHLRGYFFEMFPRLLPIEEKRRVADTAVRQALERARFEQVFTRTFWEVRQVYADVAEFVEDVKGRYGRSLLHELTNDEIEQLAHFFKTTFPPDVPLTETDRWTIWIARKAN
jgi:ubiquinone/menaquinone biosynthesis C-methylase UbiE